MSMENYNPAHYEAIESRVANEIAKDEATIGEVDESKEFDFCADCPLMQIAPEDIVGPHISLSIKRGEAGTRLSAQFGSRYGEASKAIPLGRHHSNSIGGKRIAKVREEAAQKTIECTGPKKVPRFLGPLAAKKCSAFE